MRKREGAPVHLKRFIVSLAVCGVIPGRLAETLLRWFGLIHA